MISVVPAPSLRYPAEIVLRAVELHRVAMRFLPYLPARCLAGNVAQVFALGDAPLEEVAAQMVNHRRAHFGAALTDEQAAELVTLLVEAWRQ